MSQSQHAIQSFTRAATNPETLKSATQALFKALGNISDTQLLDVMGDLRSEILKHGSACLRDGDNISHDVVRQISGQYIELKLAGPAANDVVSPSTSLARPRRRGP